MGFFDNPSQMEFMLQRLGGEQITVIPAGGPSRVIWAIVERYSPVAGSHGGAIAKAVLKVVNDSVKGIDPNELSQPGQWKASICYPGTRGEKVEMPLYRRQSDRAVCDSGIANFELR